MRRNRMAGAAHRAVVHCPVLHRAVVHRVVAHVVAAHLVVAHLVVALVSGAAHALEPAIENSLGMQFVLVSPGEFEMGRAESLDALASRFPLYDAERLQQLDDETPAHRVRITRAFYLGRHEVTVGQFRRFLEASGYVPESIRDGTGAYGYNADYDPATSPRHDAFEGRSRRYSWRAPGFAQDEDHPVVNVTWNDAVAFARWLGETEGVTYRLPTEAEWEYACKAGAASRIAAGDDPESLVRVGNTFDSLSAAHWPKWRSFALQGSDGFAFTAPVGSFEPDALGLFDMLGNAWEWVADSYGETYYASSPSSDPQGPSTGSVRVRRGGSWHTWSLYARCTFRNWNTPQSRYPLLGMRLVRVAEP